jgi:hypothetical protein
MTMPAYSRWSRSSIQKLVERGGGLRRRIAEVRGMKTNHRWTRVNTDENRGKRNVAAPAVPEQIEVRAAAGEPGQFRGNRGQLRENEAGYVRTQPATRENCKAEGLETLATQRTCLNPRSSVCIRVHLWLCSFQDAAGNPWGFSHPCVSARTRCTGAARLAAHCRLSCSL